VAIPAWVDDLIGGATDDTAWEEFTLEIQQEFEISDLG
jgi:hypothetical protein